MGLKDVGLTQTLAAQDDVSATCGDPDGGSEAVFQITGTWTGTVTFETAAPRSTTWVALFVLPSNTDTAVTTATANGLFRTRDGRGGGCQCRVRLSTPGTGAAVVEVSTAHYR